MKKTLLLAGVACVLCSTNALAGWRDAVKDAKYYIGADYAFTSYDFSGSLGEAKKSYNSGVFNMGTRMDKVGVEMFGQWSGKRTKDLAAGEKLKTRVDAYGIDLYGYQPLGCEGKYDLLATIGAANYYFKGDGEGRKSANRIGYRIGGGAMYNFNDRISARVVGRYSYIGAKSLNHAAEVTAGLRYTF